jgi:hypothetical protein
VPEARKYLTTKELAKRWGFGPGTLEAWRTKGIGPKFLKVHTSVIYALDEVLAFEAGCTRTSTEVQS